MTYSIRQESVAKVIPILTVLLDQLEKQTREFVLPLRDNTNAKSVIYQIRQGIHAASELNMEPYNRLKDAFRMSIVKGGIRFKLKALLDFSAPIEVLPVYLKCEQDVRSFDDVEAWLAAVDPKGKIDAYQFEKFNLDDESMEAFFKWVIDKGLHVSKSGPLVKISKES